MIPTIDPIEGRLSPFLIEAGEAAVPEDGTLLTLFQARRGEILRMAAEYGSVLFRGFDLADRVSFDDFVTRAVKPSDYVYGNSPRSRITEAVYTSTEFPSEFAISFHNELSYCASWPRYLFFFCSVSPEEGGETPLVDSHALWKALPGDLRMRFEKRGLLYFRNLNAGKGLGPSWMKTFGTPDRGKVEDLCRAGGIRFAWKEDGTLGLSEQRPATRRHPETGDVIWFNQADQFHPSNHPAEVCAALSEYFRGRERDMPHYCQYGDGSPIDPADLETIRETEAGLATAFQWKRGDLLLIDNMKTAHGRNPFRGPREILVSMF